MNIPSRQKVSEAVEAVTHFEGNQTAAAKSLGLSRSALRDRLRYADRLGIPIPFKFQDKHRGDVQRHGFGWVPVRRTVREDGSIASVTERPEPTLVPVELPDPKRIKFTTTVYNRDGRADRQFVRVEADAAAREKLWEQFAIELANRLPRADPLPAPSDVNTALCAEYPVGDHHFGMLSWDEETGENYDLRIAERLLISAISHLVLMAPACGRAVIELLGDFLHYDSFKPETPTAKNILDSDSRFPKIATVALRAVRSMIDAALSRHSEVLIIVAKGNHDPASATWLRLTLAAIYEKEPRVTVEDSPQEFQYWEFGRVLVGVYHGHNVKMDKLPLIMAADKPEAWGRTKFRYWRTGHIHHAKNQAQVGAHDFSGCSVESFRVLGPTDAWAHERGYRSFRDMKMILLHQEFGEVARNTVNPRMLEMPLENKLQ